MAAIRTIAEIQSDVISVEARLMQAYQKAFEERTDERIYNIFKWTVSKIRLHHIHVELRLHSRNNLQFWCRKYIKQDPSLWSVGA